MVPDESGVTVIPNNNFFPNRSGLKPRYVILHGTAGGTSAEAIANYFASTEGTPGAATSHYIIGQAGGIVQAVSERDGAWGNGGISVGHDTWWNSDINPNNVTISIEHCKSNANNSNELTTPQKAASFRLILHICQRWNIPMRTADANGGITGHFSLDPVNRSRCPGPYPWDELWAYLNIMKELNMAVPKDWKDDGKTLTAPNGHRVVKGFRDYVLAHTWPTEDWPLSEEYAATRPGLEPGTQQIFRATILDWTPKTGVLEHYAGEDWLAMSKQISDLQAQITKLQNSSTTNTQMLAALKLIAKWSEPYK